MNIDQVIAKLEAEESLTAAEVEAFTALIDDKDVTPYGSIQAALQILELDARGPRQELRDRLLENLPEEEEPAPPAEGDDDLIPSADETPEGPTNDPGPEGVEGEDGAPPAPPAAEGHDDPPGPDGTEGEDGKPAKGGAISASDIEDAKAAAAAAEAEEQEEKGLSPDQVRPPEGETEEEKAAKAKEMEEAEEQARIEREEREKAEAEEQEAAEKAEAEAREKAEQEAAKSEEDAVKEAKKAEKKRLKKILKEGCERHNIDEDYLERIKKYINRGDTIAQMKDGSRRIFKMTVEAGGRNAAERECGADLDFIWNEVLEGPFEV